MRRLLQEPGSPSFIRKTGRRLKRRRLLVQVREPSLLRRGPGQAAGILDRDTPELVTGGDKEGFEFRSPEGAIGDHVRGDRDGLQEFSCGGKDIDTGLVFIAGLHRGFGKVEAGGGEEASLGIQSHAVGPAVATPVEEELAALRSDRAVWLEIEAPELAVSPQTFIGTVVHIVSHEEEAVVGRDQDAVGAVHLVGDDAGDLMASAFSVCLDEIAVRVTKQLELRASEDELDVLFTPEDGEIGILFTPDFKLC